MRRHTGMLGTALVAFALGMSIAPAVSASYPGPYAKIFGHSTSCALGRASVNDSTDRGGAYTANFNGCSSSAGARAVPAGYLRARAYVVRNSNGAICGVSSLLSNTTSAASRDASTPRTSYSNYCDMTGYYFGAAVNCRDSDAGDRYCRDDRVTDEVVYFNSSLT